MQVSGIKRKVMPHGGIKGTTMHMGGIQDAAMPSGGIYITAMPYGVIMGPAMHMDGIQDAPIAYGIIHRTAVPYGGIMGTAMHMGGIQDATMPYGGIHRAATAMHVGGIQDAAKPSGGFHRTAVPSSGFHRTATAMHMGGIQEATAHTGVNHLSRNPESNWPRRSGDFPDGEDFPNGSFQYWQPDLKAAATGHCHRSAGSNSEWNGCMETNSQSSSVVDLPGHHECEIFHGCLQHESAESTWKWNSCTKNPGHKNFISAKDFKDNHLQKLNSPISRDVLTACVDLTVRLRVYYTSTDRPEDDEFSRGRGTYNLRTGTGRISSGCSPMFNQPCVCCECNGKIAKRIWSFRVSTALHVVYNTEEAKETKVDLFLDDESCESEEKMRSMWAERTIWTFPAKDGCEILFSTCDEALGERLESMLQMFNDYGLNFDPSDLDFLPTYDKDSRPVLIVSHPHGQPKKITVGEARHPIGGGRFSYTAPTCPGSSGASVFRFRDRYKTGRFTSIDASYYAPIHSGCLDEMSAENRCQLNFGFEFVIT